LRTLTHAAIPSLSSLLGTDVNIRTLSDNVAVAAESAWVGVIGALGGVTIAGAVGLGSSALTRRWTARDRAIERNDGTMALRREVYVRYMVATEALANAIAGFAADPEWRARHVPTGVMPAITVIRNADPEAFDHYYAARNEAQLVASESVRTAIGAYADAFTAFNSWLLHASDVSDASDREPKMDQLIDAMRAEFASE
jgi:hypothetical protein